MQKSKNIQKQILVFSKWSRKGFAVFASLGKVVKIGQLNVEICKQAIKKNINLLEAFFVIENEKLKTSADDFVDLLFSELLLQNLLTAQITELKKGNLYKINRRKKLIIKSHGSILKWNISNFKMTTICILKKVFRHIS